MKISITGFLIRAIITVIIIFSLYGLFIQFIFSYFNQSVYGPELTFLNFAGPLLLTIFILILSEIRLLSNNTFVSKVSSNLIIATVLLILLTVLVIWQIWYLVNLYEMKANLDFTRKFTELMPITTGLIATLYFIISRLKRKHTV